MVLATVTGGPERAKRGGGVTNARRIRHINAVKRVGHPMHVSAAVTILPLVSTSVLAIFVTRSALNNPVLSFRVKIFPIISRHSLVSRVWVRVWVWVWAGLTGIG